MKAVFLGASADSFARVYGPQQREALAQRLDMDFSLHSSLQDAALRDAGSESADGRVPEDVGSDGEIAVEC